MAANGTSDERYGRAIAVNLFVAFLMVLTWGVVSLNGNAEQESFNRGGIGVVAAMALIYLATSSWLTRHPMSAGGTWFVRRGGMCLIVAGMVLYIMAMSLWHGRVL